MQPLTTTAPTDYAGQAREGLVLAVARAYLQHLKAPDVAGLGRQSADLLATSRAITGTTAVGVDPDVVESVRIAALDLARTHTGYRREIRRVVLPRTAAPRAAVEPELAAEPEPSTGARVVVSCAKCGTHLPHSSTRPALVFCLECRDLRRAAAKRRRARKAVAASD